jgi:hypothetical protein
LDGCEFAEEGATGFGFFNEKEGSFDVMMCKSWQPRDCQIE